MDNLRHYIWSVFSIPQAIRCTSPQNFHGPRLQNPSSMSKAISPPIPPFLISLSSTAMPLPPTHPTRSVPPHPNPFRCLPRFAPLLKPQNLDFKTKQNPKRPYFRLRPSEMSATRSGDRILLAAYRYRSTPRTRELAPLGEKPDLAPPPRGSGRLCTAIFRGLGSRGLF